MYIANISITYQAQATKSELDVLDSFQNESLKMNSYDVGGEQGSTGGNGSCISYYLPAKQAFNDLSEIEQQIFKTSSEYAAAKLRFEEWADKNNDGAPYDGNETIVTLARANRISIFNEGDVGNTTAIIIIVSLFSLTAVGGFFFIKKKKQK